MGAGGFRTAYRGDVAYRVADFLLHCAAAFVLVRLFGGPFYFQWLPDVCVPVIWTEGMITNRFLPNDSFWILLHRSIGSWFFACAVLVVSWQIGAHFLVHAMIDAVTHENWRRNDNA
jgi:hypothetical protein